MTATVTLTEPNRTRAFSDVVACLVVGVSVGAGDRRDPAVARRLAGDGEARLRVDPRRADQPVSAGDRCRRRHGRHRSARCRRRRRQQALAAARRTYFHTTASSLRSQHTNSTELSCISRPANTTVNSPIGVHVFRTNRPISLQCL